MAEPGLDLSNRCARHRGQRAGEVAKVVEPEAVDAGEDVLLRVFFTAYGERIVLLLGGYDKGADPGKRRQEREIDVARKRLTAFKAQRAATKRAAKKAPAKKRRPPRRR